jgi:15-cis-phytoene synthase
LTPFVRALDAAGITDRDMRRGYRGVLRSLLRADPAHCVAVRCLVPPALQPHLLAAYWFGDTADTAADSGPRTGRTERFDRWTDAALLALDGGSTDPRMAAFVHTVTECQLPVAWIHRFLDGMREDAHCTVLHSEEEFQRYVDRVSLPYLMLLLGVHPGCRGDEKTEAFRQLAALCQRVDFLADLADDTRAVRARLSGPTPADQVARARTALRAALPVLDLTPPELRPMMNAFLHMHALHLDAIERSGDRILRRTVRHPLLPTLRLLLTSPGQVRHA